MCSPVKNLEGEKKKMFCSPTKLFSSYWLHVNRRHSLGQQRHLPVWEANLSIDCHLRQGEWTLSLILFVFTIAKLSTSYFNGKIPKQIKYLKSSHCVLCNEAETHQQSSETSISGVYLLSDICIKRGERKGKRYFHYIE